MTNHDEVKVQRFGIYLKGKPVSPCPNTYWYEKWMAEEVQQKGYPGCEVREVKETK